ncbi:histidine phosphatase family protein [Candidatus Woesearchaeota archaeon]|nr:histidine phosphatase family protein [Candidatus Woesearchaeota archaeon]
MIIYFMRHGETTGDVENRYGGDYDDHLTLKGRKQTDNLAKKLLDMKIKKIISSPRKRAQQSAQIIARRLGLPAQVVKTWRERNFYGTLTGMKKEEAQQKHPELAALTQSYKNNLPKAETYNSFKKRILDAFAHTKTLNTDTVLVVAHSGPITCIARELLGKELKIHDCGLIKVDTKTMTFEMLGGVEPK